MASLIEDLITTLTSENEIYQELLPIAKDKTHIIVKNNLEDLQKITEEEQLLVEKITPLEHKREDVVLNIGTVLSIRKDELHITKIIEALKNQPEHQEELRKIHEKLKATVNQLVDINNHNQKLIKHSLEMLEFNMNFIQSTRTAPSTNGYTKGAYQDDSGMPAAGMFDTKQ